MTVETAGGRVVLDGTDGRDVVERLGGMTGNIASSSLDPVTPVRSGAPVYGGFGATAQWRHRRRGSRDVSLEEPFGFLRGGPAPSTPVPDPATDVPPEDRRRAHGARAWIGARARSPDRAHLHHGPAVAVRQRKRPGHARSTPDG
ncbi:hypothetical protein GCM10010495_01430 [Kitasatospora herbaricolor]|nr:hypothetical protein GCM10010495_01430 [Kitasatospora herbaricolor]